MRRGISPVQNLEAGKLSGHVINNEPVNLLDSPGLELSVADSGNEPQVAHEASKADAGNESRSNQSRSSSESNNVKKHSESIETVQNVQQCTEKAQAVLTRSQAKKTSKPVKPLKVPNIEVKQIGAEQLKKAQQEDVSLKKLWEKAVSGEELRTRGSHVYKYEIKRGLLYRVYLPPNGNPVKQIVVPTGLRKHVMAVAHDTIMAGHLLVGKTLDRICSSFFWPGVSGDVTRYCRSCDLCQRTQSKGKVTKVPLQKMPIIETPFSKVAIDLMGPFDPVTDNGNRYVLTLVDYATRYPEAKALKTTDTPVVAEALLEMYSRLGLPREVLSDNGPQFISDLMKEVNRLLSIKQLRSTPYHPICNGLCEKWNGTLKQMLRKLCTEKPKDWDRYLTALLFAYREVPQESLGFSPFELMYGRTVRGPLQVLKELWTDEVKSDELRNTYEYVLDLRNRIQETCELAHSSLAKAQSRAKHYYDRKARPRSLAVGEEALVLLPTEHNKLKMMWKGPYKVVERPGLNDYKLDLGDKTKIFHINLLKKYYRRDAKDGAVAGVAIIEPGLSDGVIDDEGLLDFGLHKLGGKETWRDVKINPELSDEQKQQVLEILEEYQDVFTENPGLTNLIEHTIELTDDKPIRVKQYPMPYAERENVEDEIVKMYGQDIIEKGQSDYNFPIVMVKKKDGSNRFCVNFQKLNAVTKFDTEPQCNSEDIFAKLAKDKYFSKFDCAKGYWNIPMAESSKHLTSFSTPSGSYQFRRLPFGLVNSGATFNRLMRKVLDGAESVDNFVDDTIGHTLEWEAHLVMLRDFLSRMRKAGLTLRPSKCMIGYLNLDFVGHVVGDGKLGPTDEKIEKINEAKIPETKKQVRSFLGLAGWYQKFVPNFASIAAPLTDLLKKGQPNKVIWGEAQNNAFENLKQCLSKRPILRLPDFERQFVVQVDASESGVGASLMQEYDGELFPVAFTSKKLLPRERKYSVIEREALSLVFAIKKWHNYLYGRDFIVETDHAPLVYINRKKIENGRIMRWALFLQTYRFLVRNIKGSQNVAADYMSRVYV